jgi:hypothetical protein
MAAALRVRFCRSGILTGLRLLDTISERDEGGTLYQDQNSAFDQTGLLDEFRRARVPCVWTGKTGVFYSALDARRVGLAAYLADASGRAGRRRSIRPTMRVARDTMVPDERCPIR